MAIVLSRLWVPVLLFGNALLHYLLAYYYLVRTRETLYRYFVLYNHNEGTSVGLMRYLGALNIPFLYLSMTAGIRAVVFMDVRLTDFVLLSMANVCQTVGDIIAYRHGLVRLKYLQLTIPSAILAICNALLALLLLRPRRKS